MFIAHGCNPIESGGGYGIEVYLIHADSIEEAINLCPLPKEEMTIERIRSTKTSKAELICKYYE